MIIRLSFQLHLLYPGKVTFLCEVLQSCILDLHPQKGEIFVLLEFCYIDWEGVESCWVYGVSIRTHMPSIRTGKAA